MTADLSSDEFNTIRAWVADEFGRMLGAPFDPTEANSMGVWHVPREPISWDYAGVTVFRPVDGTDEMFIDLFSRLSDLLKTCQIVWTILVYEQRLHSGKWVCSAEPVADIGPSGVRFNPARFVQEVPLIPDQRAGPPKTH